MEPTRASRLGFLPDTRRIPGGAETCRGAAGEPEPRHRYRLTSARGCLCEAATKQRSPDKKKKIKHLKPDEFRTMSLCNQNISWKSRPRGVGLPRCSGLPVALRGGGDRRGAPEARTRPPIPAGRPPPAPSTAGAHGLPPPRTPGQIPKNDTTRGY